MECIILVRTDIDYSELNSDNFSNQAINWGNLSGPPIVQQHLLEVWRNTFYIDYFGYRSQLKKIGESNLRFVAANNTNVRIVFGFDEFQSLLEEEDDAWIIPIDDDDWLHPNIIESIRQSEPSKTLVRWHDYWWDLLKNQKILHHQTAQFHYLGSNNWAIKKSRLKQYELAEAAMIASNHIVAWNQLCRYRKHREEYQDLEECLSLYLFHIGSLTNIINAANFPRQFLTRMSKITIDAEMTHPAHWAQPWADQYKILHDELTATIKLL